MKKVDYNVYNHGDCYYLYFLFQEKTPHRSENSKAGVKIKINKKNFQKSQKKDSKASRKSSKSLKLKRVSISDEIDVAPFIE